jgi:ABC-2 type transport system ATP-binding protein
VAAIEVEELCRTYRSRTGIFRRKRAEVHALNGISFSVERGELFGLLGPNGAGKTTTIKILTTLLLPTSGSARVLGFDPATDPGAIRRRIGHVFGGDRGLYDRLSALDNLRYFADLYRVPVREKRKRIAELLDLVGLTGRERERVETYSRGMRQRLHIARGLLHDPEILFLDEPTIGLDPVGARELREVIGGLRSQGKTILLTTHYMEEADQLCDRVAIMDHGKILALDTPAALKQSVDADTVVTVKAGGDPDQLAALLTREVAGVTRSRRTDNGVQLHVQGSDRLVPRIVLAAERGGFDLSDVSVSEPSLETVFINLTGKELRD